MTAALEGVSGQQQCSIIYKITVPLLRTLRFPELKICETTDELG